MGNFLKIVPQTPQKLSDFYVLRRVLKPEGLRTIQNTNFNNILLIIYHLHLCLYKDILSFCFDDHAFNKRGYL